MLALCLVPIALQGLAILVDEAWFHHRRGLPRWEQIGHPLDTLTVAAGFAWLCLTRPDQSFALPVYIALGAFSCLFVTKDTPLHARVCNAGEMWLHAVLFVLHPLVFVASGFIWWFGLAPGLLAGQLVVMLVYASYQFFYWRWWWHRRQSNPSP